jgi:hypothetical protein
LAARVLGGEDPKRIPIIYSFSKKFALDPSVLPRLRGNWSVGADVMAQAAKQ